MVLIRDEPMSRPTKTLLLAMLFYVLGLYFDVSENLSKLHLLPYQRGKPCATVFFKGRSYEFFLCSKIGRLYQLFYF